jgi:hypothetical protein
MISFNFPPYWKSNYKFKCSGCNKSINRGDLITKIIEYDKGITLRTYYYKNGFFTKNIGQRIVHKNCTINNYMTFYNSESKLKELITKLK